MVNIRNGATYRKTSRPFWMTSCGGKFIRNQHDKRDLMTIKLCNQHCVCNDIEREVLVHLQAQQCTKSNLCFSKQVKSIQYLRIIISASVQDAASPHCIATVDILQKVNIGYTHKKFSKTALFGILDADITSTLLKMGIGGYMRLKSAYYLFDYWLP